MRNWLDRSLEWVFFAACALGIIAFIVLVIPLMAHAQHDKTFRVLTFSYSCTDLDASIALVQAGLRREKMRRAAENAGICVDRKMPVVYHQVVEEVIWLGDGLDDMMVIVEGVTPDGSSRFAWIMKSYWVRFYGSLPGDA